MKKRIFLRFAAIALLSAAAWLTSCDTATTDNPDSADTVLQIEQSHDTASATEKATEHTHEWQDATCTAPKICSSCSATEGEMLGHTWQDATCMAPKTCVVCSATDGAKIDHSWKKATCTAPKTCSVCSATQGGANGHDYTAGICNSCSARDSWYETSLKNFADASLKAGELHTDTLEALVNAYKNIYNQKNYNYYISQFTDNLTAVCVAVKDLNSQCQVNENLKPMASDVQASWDTLQKILNGDDFSPERISDLIGESAGYIFDASETASRLLLEFQIAGL